MAGDEELNELLDELDRQTAAENPDQAVERARESLEETLAGLKLTPEEETALADELRQLRELTQKLDETTIEIALTLDGSGVVSVSTGLPFFDHMVAQLGKHAGFDSPSS